MMTARPVNETTPWRVLIGSAILAFAIACASAPKSTVPTIAAFDPVGDYEMTITDDGKPSTATMTVTGTPGTYTGVIRAQGRPDVSITTLTTSGSKVTVTGDVSQGVLLFRFEMTGETLRGDWSLRGKGGKAEGRHIRPGAAK